MRLFATLLIFFVISGAKADDLTLTFIRSPLGINWKSPNTLAASTIKNSLIPFKKRAFSISHVFVGLKCDSIGWSRHTGMTSAAGHEDRDLLLKEAYGLGVVFHTYRGHLETNDEVIAAMKSYEGSKRFARMNLKISASTCARLKQYLEEYEAAGYGEMYSGLQARPRRREGSGCSAFGMSFLELAGLMKSEYQEEWQEKIFVPLRLVGGPMTGRRVSLFKVLTSVFAKWGQKSSAEHVYLEAWNPEKMHEWVRRTHQDVRLGKRAFDIDWEVSQQGETREISADMTHIPTPTEPIWQI